MARPSTLIMLSGLLVAALALRPLAARLHFPFALLPVVQAPTMPLLLRGPRP